MDGKQFDALVRSLGRLSSRRTVATGLAGVLGGLLQLLPASESLVEAKRRKKAKRKQGQLKRKGKGKKKKKKKGKKRRKHQTPVSPPPSPPASPPVACTPAANPCGSRECGAVDNGCGTLVTCGANGGDCPGTDICNANGRCRPAACQGCAGCCDAAGTCAAGTTREACGRNGGDCETCNPEVTCVNGECTCSQTSCAQGCCTTDANGRPFCDNTKRPCGNTCIPKEECCTGVDSSNRQVRAGCLAHETCGVDSQGFGQCQCGGGVCHRNQGCCTLVNGEPTCDVTLRPCGDICIPREQCCRDGQPGCDDGVSCTTEACQLFTGTGVTIGICEVTVQGVCSDACAAGKGYGNYFPEDQMEVVCRDAVNGLRCYCWRTTEGDNVCTEDFYTAPPCHSSTDCDAGEVCIRSGLTTGSNACARICS